MPHARYDSNGDIILEREEDAVSTEELAVPIRIVNRVERETRKVSASAWTLVHDEHAKEKPSAFSILGQKSKGLMAKGTTEGKAQLAATIAGAEIDLSQMRQSLRSLPNRVRGALRKFWNNANTPVMLPKFVKPGRKPPTKLLLFIVDTIRFGGIFAAIFVVLFVGINYQSFWSIAKAEFAIGRDAKTEQALAEITSGRSEEAADPSAIAGAIVRQSENSDLLSYLPSVGPHEDRLIIPKLGENVPIVRPSMDALMHEDWKQFEKDIQSSLHDGVVHYPGSAKPGQAGNFFLTGHSSYYPWDDGRYKDVFARLSELATGDTYSVYYGGDLHTYRVTGKKEVRPSDVSVLDQPTDKRIATLMTCTPIGTTLRRLIISAEEIDPATSATLNVGQKAIDEQKTPVARVGSLPI